MPLATILGLIAGLVLLISGAELLVRGASRLALAAGLPPLVVGLTIVAFGTSAPEVLVTVTSSLGGQANVAIGNVVGSNIFNVLFILGLAAVITPLAVHARLVRVDVPIMIGASIVVIVLALDHLVSRVEGLGLLAALAAYTGYLIHQARGDAAGPEGRVPGAEDLADAEVGLPVAVGLVAGGLALLVAGAWLLVEAAVTLAQALGVSDLVIGLTIVAVGTSLPEVATSIVAAVRGQRDIAVANVVGSNIFNLLAVLGLGGLAAPSGLPVAPGALAFDLPVMLAVAVATLPLVYTGHRLDRWEGGVFLGYYVTYAAFLILEATDHAAQGALRDAMVWFVMPLTALTLAVAVYRAIGHAGPPHS